MKLVLLLMTAILASSFGTNTTTTTESFQILVEESQNKTQDLINEQTELIKKIVTNHKATSVEYPLLTRKEVRVNNSEIEEHSLEELREKCQKFTKLFPIPEKEAAADAFDSPDLLEEPNRKIINYPVVMGDSSILEAQPSGTDGKTLNDQQQEWYRTSSSQKQQDSVSPVQTVSYPSHSNIKYVQLEPIILQKMILNNGKMLFYWYKSFPTIPQYLPTAQRPTIQLYPSTTAFSQTVQKAAQRPTIQRYPSITAFSQTAEETAQQPTIQSYPSITAFSQTAEAAATGIENEKENLPRTTTTTTTTTTTEKLLPNYEIEYGTVEKNDENMYKKRMKFVLPLPYPALADSKNEDEQIPTKIPWHFDQYAYYPKFLQPSMVNVPMPYSPTFHMIRTLTIPDKLAKRDT